MKRKTVKEQEKLIFKVDIKIRQQSLEIQALKAE